MILRYQSLCQFPNTFLKLTGLDLDAFQQVLAAITPRYHETEHLRKSRADRQRAIGGGGHMELKIEDQLVLALIWRYHYPKQDVLGQFYGISQPTVWRYIQRIEPLLTEMHGFQQATPLPSRKQRRSMAELLSNVPELVGLIGYHLAHLQEHV